ncbi:MAG: class I SAM-dependent methyltransferase [Candidatus Thorarchaeota archaeon]
MRIEIFIFNEIKKLSLKIPGIQNLFFKFESYIFDIFKVFNFRRFFGKKLRKPIQPNEVLIKKFKNLYEKNFFDESLNIIIESIEEKIKSAWRGHHYFALWLVKELQPSIIVDLGVDRGFSTLIFASQQVGEVYGIDWFKKTNYSGKLFDDYVPCMRNVKVIQKKFGIKKITIIQAKFSKVAEKWKVPIDILHIDGSHVYESVKEDYEIWSKFLNKDGVILFHDTNAYPGVVKFFNELNLPKFNFLHSYGLGVISKNELLMSKIEEKWNL